MSNPGPKQIDHQAALEDRFGELVGGRPEWYVRAPGRVNLIGDHTDYNGLPVFPMALQRAVHVAGRSRVGAQVRVVNSDARYHPCEFVLTPELKPGERQWCNYVMAGGRALAEHHGAAHGFDAVVSSTIPIAAGLSSSSALVVGAGLACARANDVHLEPLTMADLMARAERFVGTLGGAMDQAVCLGGVSGCAIWIEFDPLELRLVEVPESWRFVAAHSLQPAEKSGADQRAYNSRATDCRLALERIVRALNWDTGTLGEPGYRKLLERFGSRELIAVAEHVLEGNLLMRFRHTVSEGARVLRAAAAMSERNMADFGALMVESHASLRDDYEVSTHALDALVEALLDGGCVGARLTGAGFGGCAVALCAAESVDAVMSNVAASFYAPRGREDLTDLLFECVPSDGACVMDV